MSCPNVLAGLSVDRSELHRRDAEWLSGRVVDPKSEMLIVLDGEVRAVEEGGTVRVLRVPPSAIEPLPTDEVTFLGLDDDRAVFAAELTSATSALPGRFAGLRDLAPMLDHDDGALVAYAVAINNWHRRCRHCSVCGWAARTELGGHRRHCTNPACGVQHFPRTDPAVIMLVVDGDRCLLGRQAAWPEGRYSALAGFVEPGESLEDAVAREVMEEVGLPVKNVRYHSSQPWPLPASLMVGFLAEADGFDLRVDAHELEDARWFTRDELLRDQDLRLPPPIAIAHRLITEWLAQPR